MSKTYVTVQGDMWDAVAYRMCGDCSYTPALMRMNPGLTDVWIFEAGVVLALPEETAEEAAPALPWKKGIPAGTEAGT